MESNIKCPVCGKEVIKDTQDYDFDSDCFDPIAMTLSKQCGGQCPNCGEYVEWYAWFDISQAPCCKTQWYGYHIKP